MSELVNGASKCSKVECCIVCGRSERRERTNKASNRIAGSKRDCQSRNRPEEEEEEEEEEEKGEMGAYLIEKGSEEEEEEE